jgi:prepilin-type N-terminal cleavage/methylation domain-containing protein
MAHIQTHGAPAPYIERIPRGRFPARAPFLGANDLQPFAVLVAAWPRCRARRAPGARGFTLLEMMVVLGIIGIVMGIGAGMFMVSREDTGLKTGFQSLLGMARFAQSQALVHRAPSCIRVDMRDPLNPRVEVLIDRTFGLWHAEDLRTTGAYGIDGRPQGVSLEPGKIGFAFHFHGSGSVQVDNFEVPDADAVTVEAWVFPSSHSGRQGIVEKGRTLSLRMERQGELAAAFGAARLFANDVHLPLSQWSHVRLTAGDGAATLALNDQDLVSVPLAALPKPESSPLVIGAGFHGLIDEIAVRGRVIEDWAVLHHTLKLTCANAAADPKVKGIFRIYFSDQGRLDAQHHGGPITLTLAASKGTRKLTIGWMGTVEKIEER